MGSKLGGFASFVIGMIASVAVGASLFVFFAGSPSSTQRAAGTPGVWTWKDGATALTYVPYTAPIATPALARTADGHAVVFSQDFATDGNHFEKLDPATGHFVRLPGRPVLDTDDKEVRWDLVTRLGGAQGKWLQRPLGQTSTRIVPLTGWPDGGAHGPALSEQILPSFAIQLAGDQIAALYPWQSSYSTGGLLVAGPADPQFHAVQMQPPLSTPACAAGPAGGSRILVTTRDAKTSHPLAFFVDTASGVVTPGPPFTGPYANKAVQCTTSLEVDDGTVIDLVDEGKTTSSLEASGDVSLAKWIASIVALLAIGVALVVSLVRRWVQPRGVIAGFVVGAVLLAITLVYEACEALGHFH